MPMFHAPIETWESFLVDVGVKARTAELVAPIFAAKMKPGVFSKGEAELPDFLSTILHESGNLEKLKESGRYSAQRIREIGSAAREGSRWRSLVPRADHLAYNEEAFFEACYGGRMGNRPEGAGDGALYPGRAYIGLTGRDNYAWVGDAVGQDLLGVPTLAEGPWFALDFTVAWWEGKVPDRCLGDERAVRRIVNGGDIGLPHVVKLCAIVRGALACR